MIRCVKLWTGDDRKSHFEEGFIDLEPGARGDALSVKFPVISASFQESHTDPHLGWHPDAARCDRLSPDAALYAYQLQRLQG